LHLKFATFLLDNDAEVNHVDKGGHTCLEFAAKHGNLGLCALLLRFGARVKRDAEFISLSTVNLLDPEVCEDMTCRQLLRTKYNEEVRIEEEEKDRLRKIREDKEQAERDAERRRAIEWARLNKANAHLERELYVEHLRIEDMKMKKREEAMKRRLQILEEKKNENGTWKKVSGRAMAGGGRLGL
jgi:MoxR-like ATPase